MPILDRVLLSVIDAQVAKKPKPSWQTGQSTYPSSGNWCRRLKKTPPEANPEAATEKVLTPAQ